MAQNNIKHNGSDVYEQVIVPSGLQSIVNEEKIRLDQKKEKVDQAYFTKKRSDGFTRSAISRRQAHQNMLYVFLVVCILVLLIYLAQSVFFIIPDLVYDIAYIIVVSTGIITLLLQYTEIQKRSNMDFDKIDFGYLLDSNKIRDPDAKKRSILTQAYEMTDQDCKGESCCPTGSVFQNNKCVVGVESFLSIGPSHQPNPEPPKEIHMTTNKSNSSDFQEFTQRPSYSSTV